MMDLKARCLLQEIALKKGPDAEITSALNGILRNSPTPSAHGHRLT